MILLLWVLLIIPVIRLIQRKMTSLTKTRFLKLLITQFHYQNSLEPVDNKAFIAQFTYLEQMTNLNTSMTSMLDYMENMIKMTETVNKAESKGVKGTLVLMAQIALVVNIKNKTVITAMEQENMNVFT